MENLKEILFKKIFIQLIFYFSMDLKDKVVLVTGSSQGIGAETALLFAKEGANVVVTYNSNRKKAENIFKECKKCKDAFLVKLNVDDEKSIKECVEKVVDKFGTI